MTTQPWKAYTLLTLLFCLLPMLLAQTLEPECSNFGLLFKGDNGFQSISDWHDTQEFTLSFWVKIEDQATDPQGVIQAFLVKGATSCDIDGFGWFRFNQSVFWIMGGTDICGANALVVDLAIGEWTHLAVAVRELEVELYVNGDSVDRRVKTSIRFGDVLAPFKVGLGPDPDSGLMTGEMDEIRFWGIFRNSAEIKEDYSKSLPEAEITDDLLAYWRFEEGSNSFVKDSSTYDRETLVSSELDYVANCKLAGCLCGMEEYCVPSFDRIDTAIECPATSSTISTSSTTMITSSSTVSSTTSTTQPSTTSSTSTTSVTSSSTQPSTTRSSSTTSATSSSTQPSTRSTQSSTEPVTTKFFPTTTQASETTQETEEEPVHDLSLPLTASLLLFTLSIL